MAGRKAIAHAPARRDGRQWADHKAPFLKSTMRNAEAARTKAPAAPQSDVEIEDPRGPMLAAPPAEVALDGFEVPQHRQRLEVAFDQRDGVGEVAPCAADRRVKDDR